MVVLLPVAWLAEKEPRLVPLESSIVRMPSPGVAGAGRLMLVLPAWLVVKLPTVVPSLS